MSGLKRKLSFMFGSTLERNVLTLLNSNLTGYIDEEVCETLALVLENKSSKYSRQEAFDCILKQTGNITSWPLALRTIMVFHKLTHIQGDLVTDILMNNRIEALAKFKVPNAPLKSFVHSAMVSHYYKYLQKLSYNYDDLSICFYTNTDFPKRLKENNLSVMHFLSKVQNMLKYLIEILPLCEASLNQFGATDLVSQVTYFCLTDCYYYYAYTSHTISIMIDGICNLQQQDALFLFELYCENIQVTKQLSVLFQLRNHLKHFSLKIPTFFEVDEDLNKQVEIYITSLKKGETKPPEKKPSKGKFSAPLEIEVDDENSQPTHNLPPSLQDLSNVLIQITTPNFKSIQKKELFKPPVLTKKDSGAEVIPEPRVLSPNGPSRDGIKLPVDGQKPGSIKGGHEFNPFMAKENYLRMNSTGSKIYNPFMPISKDTTDSSPNEVASAEGVSAPEQVSS